MANIRWSWLYKIHGAPFCDVGDIDSVYIVAKEERFAADDFKRRRESDRFEI